MSEDMLNVMGSFISTELDAFENLHKELEERDEENKRLKNIINEYTKWLNEQVDYMTHHSIERMIAFDCCKHKLQELKGDGVE